MHISGIIAEYNPFHHGHQHHIKESKSLSNCDIILAVMSGNFVQRGEPAITNKWDRAKKAVQEGCDIVFELPFPYVVQSAQYFAQGACHMLTLAQVNDIIFGSESNEIKSLQKLANIDSSPLQTMMKSGQSTSRAYEQIYGEINPNDILGISYIKAIQGTNITPRCIKRTNHYHESDLTNTIASATAIRKGVYNGIDIRPFCDMEGLDTTFELRNYYPLIQHILFTTPPKELAKLFLMDEGIESHLIKQAKQHMNFDDFLNACTSNRYTTSRIRRTLIHMMMKNTKTFMDELEDCPYLRILAYNKKGKQYLHHLKAHTMIVSKFNQIPQPWRDLELKATQTYAYPLHPDQKKKLIDMELRSPIFISTNK